MRDPNRIEGITNCLAKVWKDSVPDWRLGQLICNLQRAARNDLYYVEDDELIQLLYSMLNAQKAGETNG